MVKVNNKDTRTGVFIVNFEHISYLVLVFLLLILSRQMLAGLTVFAKKSPPWLTGFLMHLY